MKGVLHVVEDDLRAGPKGMALTVLLGLERLLAAHAGFAKYLAERDAA